ncbi:MAG: FAD-dependent oxidoreductase [Solirubrobacterales bacterium]
MGSYRSRVLVAGGGIAGLEAAIALRDLAGKRVEVEVCSPREDFVYRPYAVGEPYGASHAFRYDLRRLTDHCGVSFRLDSIVAVDDEERRARTHDGEEILYDHLIVAAGSCLVAGAPGAVTFWGVPDDRRVHELVCGLCERRLRRVAFTKPDGCGWALPLYELALFAANELAKGGVESGSLLVVTPEEVPLQLFGRRASDRVAELLADRGIEVVAGAHPIAYDGGQLRIAPGGAVEADAVLSLPRIEGRRIVGVPADWDGFVAVDDHGRVIGLRHAFAVGDVTNFPVKQGGIATQQADAAAEAIAAELGHAGAPKPFDPILRGVLWTGGEPLYLSGHLGDGDDETVGGHLIPFLDQLDRAAA